MLVYTTPLPNKPDWLENWRKCWLQTVLVSFTASTTNSLILTTKMIISMYAPNYCSHFQATHGTLKTLCCQTHVSNSLAPYTLRLITCSTALSTWNLYLYLALYFASTTARRRNQWMVIARTNSYVTALRGVGRQGWCVLAYVGLEWCDVYPWRDPMARVYERFQPGNPSKENVGRREWHYWSKTVENF